MKIVKVRDYFGVDLYFFNKRSVKVSMLKYLKNIMDTFQEEIDFTSNYPEAYHLFKIREGINDMVLSEEQYI